MSYYVVTNRVEFDDEDSLYIVQASGPEQAAVKARDELLKDSYIEGGTVYTIHVVSCGHQKPVFMAGYAPTFFDEEDD